jgi:hypothetical protein
LDDIQLNSIMVGKDRVHITTIDGGRITGMILTMRLPHGYMMFKPHYGDMFEMPLDSIEKIEPIQLQ